MSKIALSCSPRKKIREEKMSAACADIMLQLLQSIGAFELIMYIRDFVPINDNREQDAENDTALRKEQMYILTELSETAFCLSPLSFHCGGEKVLEAWAWMWYTEYNKR